MTEPKSTQNEPEMDARWLPAACICLDEDGNTIIRLKPSQLAEFVAAHLAADGRRDKDVAAVSRERDHIRSEHLSVFRLASHLAAENMPRRCELRAADGDGQCDGSVVALRWVDGFADYVCRDHRDAAVKRGELVVAPRRHDGWVEEGR